MKSVMISIRPEWCAKIASGRKTIEVRKTKPKLKTPFKCYIYCTKSPPYLVLGDVFRGNWETEYVTTHGYSREEADRIWGTLNGKVIGEFICDAILTHCEMANADLAEHMGCIKREKIREYAGDKEVFGWHISDLVIFDKPKSISEFITPSETGCCNEGKCKGCFYFERGNGFNLEDDCTADFDTDAYKPLRRPPQSWCYVEEGVDNG